MGFIVCSCAGNALLPSVGLDQENEQKCWYGFSIPSQCGGAVASRDGGNQVEPGKANVN
jgi:hypothetical protein